MNEFYIADKVNTILKHVQPLSKSPTNLNDASEMIRSLKQEIQQTNMLLEKKIVKTILSHLNKNV